MINEVNQHDYLILKNILELDLNELKIIVQVGVRKSLSTKTDSIENDIQATVYSPIYEIYCYEYINYSVTNESFEKDRKNSELGKNVIMVFDKSPYLSYIESNVIVKECSSGKIIHYNICCVDHVIDLVTDSPLRITRLNDT